MGAQVIERALYVALVLCVSGLVWAQVAHIGAPVGGGLIVVPIALGVLVKLRQRWRR